MMKHLVVVESPAKAKTLKKYLGEGYEVLASYGHVRDLIPKKGAVEPENNFAMNYQVVDKNAKHVTAICQALKDADTLYLATDPDREGEAIAWNLYELIKDQRGLKNKPVYRIAFYEITKSAVQNAVANPRQISIELVHAQQARRALDYLVGFNLSPLLWKKIRRGLSAGRVQSPALRMVVERELEIEKFEQQEYWSIEADWQQQAKSYVAKLIQYNNEKIQQFSIVNQEQARELVDTLTKQAKGKLKVVGVNKSQRKRNPAPPFTTSTLQQEAVRKLGMTAKRTMRCAQQLYEGIDIGQGAVGLITYMRTDSLNIAEQALESIRAYIASKYGHDAMPTAARRFKTRSKNAQEAHEAIRPTMIEVNPEQIKCFVTADQYKLYKLIWKRTIASQMSHATINQVAIDFACGVGNVLRSNGSTIADPGFMQVYLEGVDDGKEEDEDKLLPALQEGDIVDLEKIKPNQHFTEPPPRYSEATLVKALEEHGIGRPSTYATIISTLQQREYAHIEQKRFKPTDVGRVVNKFLTQYFGRYVEYAFTANLENDLDFIANGEKDWLPVLQDFWQDFSVLTKQIDDNVERKDVTQESLDEECPDCSKPLSIRLGKRGKFIGCTAYPGCGYTRNLSGEEIKDEVIEDRSCPKCSASLVFKVGKYGKFIGCSAYPECKFIESIDKPSATGVNCPQCKQGEIIKKKTRYGSFFYPCNKYPECKYALKHEPQNFTCPKCNWAVTTIKITKRYGEQIVCPQKNCGYVEALESND